MGHKNNLANAFNHFYHKTKILGEAAMYKVIFVDDEAWALRGLETIIDWKQYGFEICEACRNVKRALEAIETYKPDVVFTDIRMPQMSGTELMESEIISRLNPLIIIVSAYRDFDVAKDAIKKGVFDYLLKPLEREAVIEVVNRIKVQLDFQCNEKLSILEYDLKNTEYDCLSRLKQLINNVPVGEGSCYICVSEGKIIQREIWEKRGNVNAICISPYEEAFMFTGTLPEGLSETDKIGISIRRENFSEFRRMIQEAICGLEGGFVYSNKEIVAMIQFYIAQNYCKKLCTKDIADHFFLSEAYIYELFSKYEDNTIMGFLKCVRMNHARRLLVESPLSVREVSEAVGFEDAGYFGRVFKKHFGCCPEKYRC